MYAHLRRRLKSPTYSLERSLLLPGKKTLEPSPQQIINEVVMKSDDEESNPVSSQEGRGWSFSPTCFRPGCLVLEGEWKPNVRSLSFSCSPYNTTQDCTRRGEGSYVFQDVREVMEPSHMTPINSIPVFLTSNLSCH
ncbi:unnamed protein product [Caretta caretta]